jgi:hypothetical protein
LDVNALAGGGAAETYLLSGVVLTQELIDTTTGLGVFNSGGFSGALTISGVGNASSGLITWSATAAAQTVAQPSVVVFSTDASDPIGAKLDGTSGTPALLQPATTVNGTVNANPVPEPATFSMVGGALLGLGLLGRRKISRQSD